MSPKFCADVRIFGKHSFVSLGKICASTHPSHVRPSTPYWHHDMLRTRGIGQGDVRRAGHHLTLSSIVGSIRRVTRTCSHQLYKGSYIDSMVSSYHYTRLAAVSENLPSDEVEGQAIECTQWLHCPFLIIRGPVNVLVLLRIQVHPRNRPTSTWAADVTVGESNTENPKLAHRHASCSMASQITYSTQTILVVFQN